MVRDWRHKFGFDQPLIVQYFRFLGDLFTGNWGPSISIARDVDVWDLISDRIPITIDLLVLPIMLGIGNYIVFGIMLGRTSNKYKDRRKAKVIQIFCYFSIAIPLFFFGMLLQYFLSIKLDLFPATGYKDPSYPDPEFVTGFYIIDALLAGETKIIFDYLYHLTLPLFIITLTSTALIALQNRSYLLNKNHKQSIISNTARTGITFGTYFIFIILIEITFVLQGIGKLFIDAINRLDYWVITGILLEILIMVSIITFISNLIFSLYKFLVDKFRYDSTLNDKAEKETEIKEFRSEEIITEHLSIREYLRNRLKSPLFIIAAILVIFFIFIAIFPHWITPYSFEEVTGYYTGSWSPPSSDHPLGTASSGRDVLGLTIWGIWDALIFGFGAVIIGLIGGSIFGFFKWISLFIKPRIESSTKQLNLRGSAHRVTMRSLIIFPIFPGIIFILLSNIILGDYQISSLATRGSVIICYYWVSLSAIGILLIPIFTRVICNAISRELNLNKIGKTIIIHIPLGFAIAIMLYEIIGFLRFAPHETSAIHLGYNIFVARLRLHTLPLASFSPGIAISYIVMSFFLLHIALQDYSSDFKE